MSLQPATQLRLDQARRNYSLYGHLRDEGDYLEWAATVLFYAAVLLVDAHAIQVGRKRVNRRGDVERFGIGW